jgi:hypothetical protein
MCGRLMKRGPCEWGRVAGETMQVTTYKKVRIDGKQAETGGNVVWLDGGRVERVLSDPGGLGARGKRGRRGVWARDSGSNGRGGIHRGGC